MVTAHHCALEMWFGDDFVCSGLMFEFEDDKYTGVSHPEGRIPPEKELVPDRLTSLVLSGN